MLGILSLFLVLPFINCLIKVGKYHQSLNQLLQHRIPNLNKLYNRSFIICHILGVFLNIATIPLLSNSLKNSLQPLPKKRADKFYTQNLLRAYALCLTWSPLEVMVITALDVTNTNYFKFFPSIISIVLIIILIDWIVSRFRDSTVILEVKYNEHSSIKGILKKTLELFLYLFGIVLIVSFIQHFLHKGFLFSMVLVIIPFSLGWSYVIGKFKRYVKVTLPHWKARTIGLSNYFCMFLSAGFFVEMLIYSESLLFLQELFNKASEHTLVFYLLIGGYFLIASLTGFHPLVSLTLLVALLNPILPAVSSLSLAIVLVTSSLASVMYSPFNLSVSILAEQLNLNPYRMGSWNLLFALSYMIISIAISYLIHVFI